MKSLKRTVCLFLLAVLVLPGYVSAGSGKKMIEVKITNLSAKVVLTPPIVAASNGRIAVFQLTGPASEALEMLAEGGSTDDLAAMFADHNASVAQATEPVPPGQTLTLYVYGTRYARISLASMILPTNDGFIALDSVRVPRRGSATYYSRGYDAGTEANDELCGSIPGPTCGGVGPSPGDNAGDEKFVHIHRGMHGVGDLDAAVYDWRNPVAKITVTRVRH